LTHQQIAHNQSPARFHASITSRPDVEIMFGEAVAIKKVARERDKNQILRMIFTKNSGKITGCTNQNFFYEEHGYDRYQTYRPTDF
jgi:hypothetical protein